MDWSTRMMQAIDYLETHLQGPVDMEKAAELANCSLFHFCRMFEVIFGVSPGEYLRRRRLSLASLDLAANKDKVIDVALRYGWESPESFTKAFKRCFGIKPSQARDATCPLETWPPIKLTILLKGDRTVKYRIEQSPSLDFVGVSIRTTSTDNQNLKTIPHFWEQKYKEGLVQSLDKKCGKMGMMGVCYYYNPADNSFAYAIAVEKGTHDIKDFPAGCQVLTIPPATYAIFECRGPMPHAIQEGWKQIYSEWFPASEYEHAGTPDFEVYPPQDDPSINANSPNFRTEIWIPIKKKVRK
ncbi:MAG: AraC family transcriptional regulator [Treponema sp.]|nr:AraC family transcriptional regulator [Treponema sp.]